MCCSGMPFGARLSAKGWLSDMYPKPTGDLTTDNATVVVRLLLQLRWLG
jgi:hypothetical protein